MLTCSVADFANSRLIPINTPMDTATIKTTMTTTMATAEADSIDHSSIWTKSD